MPLRFPGALVRKSVGPKIQRPGGGALIFHLVQMFALLTEMEAVG